MPVPVVIQNGSNPRRNADVDAAGASLVIDRSLPPYGGDQKMRVFRQHLTDDGLVTDSTNQDMRVNGSSTNVDFYVGSHETRDRYICRLDFLIADANANNNDFADLSALTNGCHLFYEDIRGQVDIHDAIKTNFELVRLCAGEPAFGSTTNTFRASNISGTAEGYFPQLDLRKTFGFVWGIRLLAGSNQKIVFRIKDDLSVGITQMDVIAYGFERFPD